MRTENNLSPDEFARFYPLIIGALEVRRHVDFMRWLQGELQQVLPHDILVAAWGNFNFGVIHYDVISALPGVRSQSTMAETITPLLTQLSDRWISQSRQPYTVNVPQDGFNRDSVAVSGSLADVMRRMRSARVHGIHDKRGRNDCLYVFLSDQPQRREDEFNALNILLPYIDTALRQVELLPKQCPATTTQVAATRIHEIPEDATATENGALSDREAEIMKWFAMGKTNGEVGSILNVSSFTVKNHMQRIFKKLDVFNRTQAVFTFSGKTRSSIVERKSNPYA